MTALHTREQVRPDGPAAAVGTTRIWVGVDTHQQTHHVGVIDQNQTRVANQEFPATEAGYRDLVQYVTSLGTVVAFGVESTGSYGAGLTRHLLVEGHEVYEVNRPEKATRVSEGKSDPIDAYSAATQVLTRKAQGRPKMTSGIVEALRALKIPRDGAVKDRTRAYSQLRDLITTAPAPIHDELIGLSSKKRVARLLRIRPDLTQLHDPLHATRHALQTLARRIRALDQEVTAADKQIAKLVNQACPTLLAMRQVGPQIASQLVITAGENIDRMRSEATYAKLTGVAPLPASSGKTNRHRLNRGGDRQANSALYLLAVGRMKNHPETIAYVQKRQAQGMPKTEIIRCLKRYLARTTYQALRTDLMTT